MIDRTTTVTILSGQSLSAAFTVGGDVEAFVVDSNFNGSLITFQSNPDGAGYKDLYDSGGFEVAEGVTPGKVCSANASKPDLAHITSGKIRAGSGAAPSVQGQNVTIGIVWRDRNSS